MYSELLCGLCAKLDPVPLPASRDELVVILLQCRRRLQLHSHGVDDHHVMAEDLALELDHDRMLLRPVAETVWARLHIYERQEQQENERLDAALQKADQPVGNLKDLRQRAWAVLGAFRVESWFTDALRQLQTDLDQDMAQLVKWRYGPAVYREVAPPPPRRRTPVMSNK